MDKEKTGLSGLILAGGKNSRMNGNKKFFLDYKGKTFGTYIYEVLERQSRIDNIYISVDKEEPYSSLNIALIPDEYENIGPMGGLVTALKRIDSEAILVVACDMPFITETALAGLVNAYEKENKTVIVSVGKKIQPLLAVYRRNMLKYFSIQIEKKCYKLMEAIDEAYKDGEICILNLEQEEKAVENINTVEEYKRMTAE